MMNLFYYQTAVGRIGIAEKDNHITNLYFDEDNIYGAEFETRETELLKLAGEQLCQYLIGRRKIFTLPLAPSGTDFMHNVWQALCEIPYGETRSYGSIASTIGNTKAARAVGNANNKNPIPIFIPCHRVIGSNGSLIGYRGGLQIKERLLSLERSFSYS